MTHIRELLFKLIASRDSLAQSKPHISLSMPSGGIMADTESQEASLELVSKIVIAYVSNNSVPTRELPGLIRSVHEALSHIGERPVQHASQPCLSGYRCSPITSSVLKMGRS